MPAEDLTGQRFERLTVIERGPDQVFPCGQRRVRWVCKCDCGNTSTVLARGLKSGNTKSCGCYSRDMARIPKCVKHGESRSRLYNIRSGMLYRCNNPNSQEYKNYGARGVKVCEEWTNSYEVFRDWALSNGYDDALSIDRIDPSGDYEPSNCRWATPIEQGNNKRDSHRITYKGETKTITEWGRALDILPETIGFRLDKMGWSIEDALEIKPQNYRYITYNGETKTLAAWAEELNLPYHTLKARFNMLHWDVEKAFTTPVRKITKKKRAEIE